MSQRVRAGGTVLRLPSDDLIGPGEVGRGRTPRSQWYPCRSEPGRRHRPPADRTGLRHDLRRSDATSEPAARRSRAPQADPTPQRVRYRSGLAGGGVNPGPGSQPAATRSAPTTATFITSSSNEKRPSPAYRRMVTPRCSIEPPASRRRPAARDENVVALDGDDVGGVREAIEPSHRPGHHRRDGGGPLLGPRQRRRTPRPR